MMDLLRQLTLVNRASIMTIDSFCLNVVRSHFQDVDIDPDFRIADQGELLLLEQDVLGRCAGRIVCRSGPGFYGAVRVLYQIRYG